MDELISKQAFKEECLAIGFFPAMISAALNRTPVVDAVPVIRCKDCKYYEIHKPKILENCERNGQLIPMMPNDFCSYGERKGNENCKL